MMPSKITFVAFPMIFGPITLRITLPIPTATTTAIVIRSGRSRPRSFRSVPRKSFERSTGVLMPMNPLR